jgi:hypothetical protein
MWTKSSRALASSTNRELTDIILLGGVSSDSEESRIIVVAFEQVKIIRSSNPTVDAKNGSRRLKRTRMKRLHRQLHQKFAQAV